MRINVLKSGMAVGAFLGLWHLIWSLLVALGWAQALIDLVLWLHFLKVAVTLAPFDPAVAAVLVLATSGVGFGVGVAFAAVWNALHPTRG